MLKMLDKILSGMIRCKRTQMKGNATMSRIKQSLPEDVSVLTGDELDGTPESNEPSAVDWAISELNNAIGTLEKHTVDAYPYIKDLKNYRKRLQDVIEKALMPF